MAFISVTRLRVRLRRHFPFFAIQTIRIARQAQKADGFVGGYLGFSAGFAFWTVTVWAGENEMRRFRNSGPHVKTMPKLIRWCDEASYAHWESEVDAAPDSGLAAEKLLTLGKLSKVRYPSEAQLDGRTWPDGCVPSVARALSPSR